jgi:hypothetical protein
MNNVIWVSLALAGVAWFFTAVVSARATLRWWRDDFGNYDVSDGDVLIHAVMAFFWPITLPTAWALFGPRSKRGIKIKLLRRLLIKEED